MHGSTWKLLMQGQTRNKHIIRPVTPGLVYNCNVTPDRLETTKATSGWKQVECHTRHKCKVTPDINARSHQT